jgi:insulysin
MALSTTSKMTHPESRCIARSVDRLTDSPARTIERITDSIETPVTDTRRYRVVKLTNQLEVLLVHDADTDKASAAMDVNVGNFSDEEDIPGMAHAVE